MRRTLPAAVLAGLFSLAVLPAAAPLAPGATLAAHGSALAAQEPVRAPARGWLGIELMLETAREGADERIRISRVVPGSPADRAGLRSGDVVVAIGGEAATPARFDRTAMGLEPGQEVRFEIDRDGERRMLTVQAAERPFLIAPGGVAVSPDSVSARIRLHLDSVRHGLERAEIRTLTAPDSLAHVMVRVRGAMVDSIRVRSLIADTARIEVLRVDPFRVGGAVTLQSGQTDTLIAVVRGRVGPGEAQVVTVPRSTLRVDSAAVRVRGTVAGRTAPVRILAPARTGTISVGAAPSAAAVLGQRAVAGAELMALNPGLSTYFGVEEGVLVVEVVEGTPAHEAGLRPGDVIVQVGDAPVTDVSGVRTQLARARLGPSPATVRIVREGAARTLEFRD